MLQDTVADRPVAVPPSTVEILEPKALLKTAPRRKWPRLALFLLVASAYFLTGSGQIRTADVQQSVEVAASVRSGHGFVIAYPIAPYGGSVRGRDGQSYSRHDLGEALLILPLTLVPGTVAHGIPSGRLEFAASLIDPIAGALCVIVAVELLCALGLRRRTAVVSSLLLAFATILWPYAHVAFDAAPTALCVLVAFWGLVRWRRSGNLRDLGWAATAVGFAIVLRSDTLFLLPALTLPILPSAWRLRGAPRRALVLAATWAGPIAVGAAVNSWYNWDRFGSALNNGTLHDPSTAMNTPLWQGLWGLSVSPGKGLIYFSPLVVVALIGWPRLLRCHRAIGAAAAFAIVAAAVGHARMQEWPGDAAWGPRYLVPVAVLFVIPLAFLLDELLSNWRRYREALAVVGVVALAAFSVQLFGMGVDYYSVMVRHSDIMQDYFAWQHSQLPYQADAFATGVTGRSPYPPVVVTDAPVPPLDWWWLRAMASGRNETAAIIGVITLSMFAGAGGLRTIRGLREPNWANQVLTRTVGAQVERPRRRHRRHSRWYQGRQVLSPRAR